MKRLFIAGLFLFFTCLYAYADTEVVGGGGDVSEGTDVGFTSITLEGGAVDDLAVKLGDGDSGIYEDSDDVFVLVQGGVAKAVIDSQGFRGVKANSFLLVEETASGVNPVHTFISDVDTGIGRAGINQLSHIAGAIEALRNNTTYSEFYPSGAGQVKIYDDGTISIPGAVAFSGISTATVDYAIGNFEDDPTFFIECDATLGNISTTLPPLADKKGRLLEVKLISATNGCYLDGNGAETIDGAAGQTITTQYNIISLIAGATEWLIR